MQKSVAIKYIILALLAEQSAASYRAGWRIFQEIAFLDYRSFADVAVLCLSFVRSQLPVAVLAWFSLRGLSKVDLVKLLDAQSTSHHVSVCDAVWHLGGRQPLVVIHECILTLFHWALRLLQIQVGWCKRRAFQLTHIFHWRFRISHWVSAFLGSSFSRWSSRILGHQ